MSKTKRADLDSMLSRAPAAATPLFDRLEWLSGVLHWVFSESPLKPSTAQEFPSGHPQTQRMRWLLHVLIENPNWKARAVEALRSIAAETQVFDLLVQAGLHHESGLLSEMVARISRRYLPLAPNDQNLEVFFFSNCQRESDADAILEIESAQFEQFIQLFHDEHSASRWISDLEEARRTLALQVAALGAHPEMRSRMSKAPVSATPFFKLHTNVLDSEAPPAIAANIQRSLSAIDDVYRHMDEHGVSIDLVYHLERMRALLNRLSILTAVLLEPKFSTTSIQALLASVIRESVHARSLRALFDDNTALIARKIVENSAETGDHYIARNAAEETGLFRSSLGGGAVTALTTIIKFSIANLPGSPFALGFLASVNYAGSFLLLQLKGFSLATKQPAMTAATLSDHLSEIDDSPMVNEIINVIRSQSLAVIGNLLAVTPGVLLFCWIYQLLFANPFLRASKAMHTIESFSIFGGTPFYAAWTGVLLFLSSLCAGWFYHWVLYRKLPQGLSRSPWLIRAVGAERALQFSTLFKKHSAGFAANVSLGLFLGLSPAVFQFLGLPLDVRHITLSTGSLAAAVMTTGPSVLISKAFWFAILGILSMGFFNIFVSFSLAMAVALRARRIPFSAGLRVFGKAAYRVLRRPSLIFGARELTLS